MAISPNPSYTMLYLVTTTEKSLTPGRKPSPKTNIMTEGIYVGLREDDDENPYYMPEASINP